MAEKEVTLDKLKQRLKLFKRTLQKNGYSLESIKQINKQIAVKDFNSVKISLDKIENSLKENNIPIPYIVVESDVTKAQIFGLVKIIFGAIAIVLLLLFVLIIFWSSGIEIRVLTESLAMVGVDITNLFGSMIRMGIVTLIFVIILSVITTSLTLHKKIFYFYNDRLEYPGGRDYVTTPYTNIVSVNYLKKLLGGNTLIIKLTGGETQKLEANFVNNIEDICSEVNDIIARYKRPWLNKEIAKG